MRWIRAQQEQTIHEKTETMRARSVDLGEEPAKPTSGLGGLRARIYPVVKISKIVEALESEGIAPAAALDGVHLTRHALHSPATRVSLNQVLSVVENAAALARDPHFAFKAGRGFHVTTYGMYGFAILCSTDVRNTVHFAVKYHALTTPLAGIAFHETGGIAQWTITPIPHPRINALLYRFVVELDLGICMSIHRDVLGQAFAPREIQVTYGPPTDPQAYARMLGCAVRFNQPENRLVFDAAWLNRKPALGNALSYTLMVKLCDEMLEEMRVSAGVAGAVRQFLLLNLMRPTGIEAAASHLHMTARTLRRRLADEHTSFRKLADELKMGVAIKYLRDTDLNVDEIAHSLGYSDAAKLRRAFHRWTGTTPTEMRIVSHGAADGRRESRMPRDPR